MALAAAADSACFAGLHDADDRPEQPDERSVVAERAQVGEAPLELHPLQRGGSLHRLFGGLGPAIGLEQARDHHGGFRARGRLEPAARGLHVTVAQLCAELLCQTSDVVAQRPIEPSALEHDSYRDHAQPEQQPHHPAGAEARHELLEPFNQIHLFRTSRWCQGRWGSDRPALAPAESDQSLAHLAGGCPGGGGPKHEIVARVPPVMRKALVPDFIPKRRLAGSRLHPLG